MPGPGKAGGECRTAPAIMKVWPRRIYTDSACRTDGAAWASAVLVRLLGEFAITAGDRAAGPWPRPSARRLCALLLVSPGRRVTRDLAREELFPRLAPRTAARSLSKALSMARTALAELGEPGAALLGADLTHLWLSPRIVVDADAQADALRAGLALPPGQERDDALAAALAADSELLPDEPYADWADRARDQLNSLRQEARLVLARDRVGRARGGQVPRTSRRPGWRASTTTPPARKRRVPWSAATSLRGARSRPPAYSSAAAPRLRSSACGSPRRLSGSTRQPPPPARPAMLCCLSASGLGPVTCPVKHRAARPGRATGARQAKRRS